MFVLQNNIPPTTSTRATEPAAIPIMAPMPSPSSDDSSATVGAGVGLSLNISRFVIVPENVSMIVSLFVIADPIFVPS